MQNGCQPRITFNLAIIANDTSELAVHQDLDFTAVAMASVDSRSLHVRYMVDSVDSTGRTNVDPMIVAAILES